MESPWRFLIRLEMQRVKPIEKSYKQILKEKGLKIPQKLYSDERKKIREALAKYISLHTVN